MGQFRFPQGSVSLMCSGLVETHSGSIADSGASRTALDKAIYDACAGSNIEAVRILSYTKAALAYQVRLRYTIVTARMFIRHIPAIGIR